MPNFRRHFTSNQIVFLTIVTNDRQPWMRAAAAKRHVVSAMRTTGCFHPYRHVAHVLLNDHLHWMLAPLPGTSLSTLVGSFKRELSLHRGPISLAGRLWQARFYDHVVRDAEDFRRHMDYLHFNPVKHGYVQCAALYPWSSLSRWIERGRYAADWGVALTAAPAMDHLE